MSDILHDIEVLRWRERKYRRIGLWVITVAWLALLALFAAGWVAGKL